MTDMNHMAETCDFKAGDHIAGRYSVEKFLGEGAFGKVYKVKDRQNGGIYALKLFKFWETPSGERESMFARFEMEFETGRVRSNYLVKSIEHGLAGENPFLVMEYCPNGNVGQFAGGRKNADLVKIGREILYGLRDLHNCGKVHRDLKPENVLLKSNGTAALTDFGLTGDKRKKITETDLFGKPILFAGTAVYMAPEQAKPQNRNVTVLPTMDIFAFGVMMYYLITDKFPFGEINDQDDLVKYLRNAREGRWDRESLIRKHPNGKVFYRVISGCLKPDFRDRLQKTDSILSLLPGDNDYVCDGADSTRRGEIVNGILLRVMQGEEHGAVYKLKDLLRGKCGVITLGRKDDSADNILPLTENLTSYISRKHCTLELSADHQWFIRDGQWDRNAANGWKNSLNGTFVNSTEVSFDGMPIHPGDIISIGDVKIRVEGY